MFEAIKACKKCGLCKHQPPLLDSVMQCQVFWVGLSAKISESGNDRPLSPATHSGSILCRVEERCVNISMYRTNIVKCVPLNDCGKLRYPNRQEIGTCLPNLEAEIGTLSPKIVFLLGNKVADAISVRYSISFSKWSGYHYSYTRYRNLFFVPVHHPSYIYTYRQKYITDYIDGIESIISLLL